MVIDEGFAKYLKEECGYVELRVIDGLVCGVTPFIFTWGFAIGLDAVSYKYRYCFHDLLAATSALHTFDGTQDPEDIIVRKGLGEDYKPSDEFNRGLPLAEALELQRKLKNV